ncbi:MAG: efflux RND transporter periplasmic adaptor subunit [Sterolibacterium sp.]|nr:efflux RND transporter periplasmic adaptor subunit [Sterolibacterium sp.]
MKSLSLLALALLACLALSACNNKSGNAPPQDHNMTAHAADHAHSGDHADEHTTDEHLPKLEYLSSFNDSTELYLERPPFFVGQPVEAVAYLSRLSDAKPLPAGKVSLILSGNGKEQFYRKDTADAPGIFRIPVIPQTTGEFTLSLLVETSAGSSRHALGSIPVFADLAAAAAAHQHHSHGRKAHGITFTKAQQWRNDFATTAVAHGPLQPSIRATAVIKAPADDETLLLSPAIGILRPAGRLVHIGQTVKKSQILAYLAPRSGGETDQASLQAATQRARIALAQAQRERVRMESLFQDEAIAEKRVLEARDNEHLAAAELRVAQARQGQLTGNDGIAIRAPIDGTIVDLGVRAGALVDEGDLLFHIANTSKLWLEARVAETDIARLGSQDVQRLTGARFTIDGDNQPVVIVPEKNGRLIAVGGVIDDSTRTVPVIFEFDNPGNLRLGMLASAQLLVAAKNHDGTENSLLIPTSAVQDENGMAIAYVQLGGESFERRLLRLGARDDAQVAVLDGLTLGERVVSRGAHLIRLTTAMATAVGHTH